MKKMEIVFIALVVVLLISVFAWQYLFNIYEVEYDISTKQLFADRTSTLVIKATPVNSLGWRAPFRDAETEFQIIEGNSLVEVLTNDFKNGLFVIKAGFETGKVVIRVKSKYSLFPSTFEIEVLPNLT